VLEPFLLQKLLNLLSIPSEIQTFFFFAMLIEEIKIRVVSRNEIDFQSSIRISMPQLLNELTDLRKFIQSSFRACVDLGCPGTLQLFSCLQLRGQKLNEVIAVPARDICPQHMVGIILFL